MRIRVNFLKHNLQHKITRHCLALLDYFHLFSTIATCFDEEFPEEFDCDLLISYIDIFREQWPEHLPVYQWRKSFGEIYQQYDVGPVEIFHSLKKLMKRHRPHFRLPQIANVRRLAWFIDLTLVMDGSQIPVNQDFYGHYPAIMAKMMFMENYFALTDALKKFVNNVSPCQFDTFPAHHERDKRRRALLFRQLSINASILCFEKRQDNILSSIHYNE